MKTKTITNNTKTTKMTQKNKHIQKRKCATTKNTIKSLKKTIHQRKTQTKHHTKNNQTRPNTTNNKKSEKK